MACVCLLAFTCKNLTIGILVKDLATSFVGGASPNVPQFQEVAGGSGGTGPKIMELWRERGAHVQCTVYTLQVLAVVTTTTMQAQQSG